MNDEFDLVSLEEKLAAAQQLEKQWRWQDGQLRKLPQQANFIPISRNALDPALSSLRENYENSQDFGALKASKVAGKGYQLMGATPVEGGLIYNFNIPGITVEPALKVYPDEHMEIEGKKHSFPLERLVRPHSLNFSPEEVVSTVRHLAEPENKQWNHAAQSVTTWPETVYQNFWAYLNGERNEVPPVQPDAFGNNTNDGLLNGLGLALKDVLTSRITGSRPSRKTARNQLFSFAPSKLTESFGIDPSASLENDAISANGISNYKYGFRPLDYGYDILYGIPNDHFEAVKQIHSARDFLERYAQIGKEMGGSPFFDPVGSNVNGAAVKPKTSKTFTKEDAARELKRASAIEEALGKHPAKSFVWKRIGKTPSDEIKLRTDRLWKRKGGK